MRAAGANRTHDHFAGVRPDTQFEGRGALLAQLRRVAAQLLLHPERRIERALRMVLVGHRGAEQREDPVAGGLYYVAVVAPNCLDHKLQRRVDQRAGFFGIEILLQLRRALDIGEQHSDELALALGYIPGCY